MTVTVTSYSRISMQSTRVNIAGSKAAELVRLSDYILADFVRYADGDALLHEVLPDQL